jgi:succinate dehydrogenase / fumarate reductase, cytochrome b subunit
MHLLSTSIGKKLVMAATGICMAMFAVIHLIGNSTIFGWLKGGINAYAHHLHALPAPIIIGFRGGLALLLLVHVWFGIKLTLENNGGRPQQYAVKATKKITFAGNTMIWTGLALLAFFAYHLLHFTFQTLEPSTSALKNIVPVNGIDMPNVLGMMSASFKNIVTVGIYGAAMVALFLHLSHGIQSFFQTVGLNNGKCFCLITKGSVLIALGLLFGYMSVPMLLFANILK